MVWTPVKPTSRAFEITKKLGLVLAVTSRQKVAVLLSPMAYMPPATACPALAADGSCSIHDTKPQRCRTMPFAANRDESDQSDLLVPRKGWECDVSPAASLVYQNKKIVDRTSFDVERAALLADAPALRDYAQSKLEQPGPQRQNLARAAQNPVAGRYIENFSAFLRFDRRMTLPAFAKQQLPVLRAFAEHTESMPEAADYHRYYTQAAEELDWFAKKG